MGIADKKSKKPSYISLMANDGKEEEKVKIVHRSYYITQEQDEKLKRIAFEKKTNTSELLRRFIDNIEHLLE